MHVVMGRETTTTRAREEGFSLIELIVVMAMLAVAQGSNLTVVERTKRISNEDRERAHAIRSVQVELDGLVREARQAWRVNASTGTRLDVSLYRGGVNRRVIFDCSVAHPTLAATRRCMRQEMLADGSLTAARVAIDLHAGHRRHRAHRGERRGPGLRRPAPRPDQPDPPERRLRREEPWPGSVTASATRTASRSSSCSPR